MDKIRGIIMVGIIAVLGFMTYYCVSNLIETGLSLQAKLALAAPQ